MKSWRRICRNLVLFSVFLGFSDPQCSLRHQAQQSDILHSLFELEQNFVQMKWQYHKYRETLYHPLWEARTQSDDSFSPERQAGGKMQYARYEHEAKSFLSLAEESQSKVFSSIDEIQSKLRKVTEVCERGEFQNCVGPWLNDLEDWLGSFELFLKKYGLQERKLSERVELTVKESPSEHHNFGERYYDFYADWAVKVYPDFLKQIRKIREKIELRWPQKCCELCEPKREEKL